MAAAQQQWQHVRALCCCHMTLFSTYMALCNLGRGSTHMQTGPLIYTISVTCTWQRHAVCKQRQATEAVHGGSCQQRCTHCASCAAALILWHCIISQRPGAAAASAICILLQCCHDTSSDTTLRCLTGDQPIWSKTSLVAMFVKQERGEHGVSRAALFVGVLGCRCISIHVR